MKAKDIMTANVVTVTPETDITAIAKLMLEHHISGVPVVDPQNRLLGIVGEGDLIHRPELGIKDRRRSWWLSLLARDQEQVEHYVKTHGLRAAEVMNTSVVTVSEDTPLGKIALLLEERQSKRAVVVRGDQLVGIVSRGDLLRGLVDYRERLKTASAPDDRSIGEQLLKTLKDELAVDYVNVTVTDGIVELRGFIRSEQERKALHIAAETMPGVRGVVDHLDKVPYGWLGN